MHIMHVKKETSNQVCKSVQVAQLEAVTMGQTELALNINVILAAHSVRAANFRAGNMS